MLIRVHRCLLSMLGGPRCFIIVNLFTSTETLLSREVAYLLSDTSLIAFVALFVHGMEPPSTQSVATSTSTDPNVLGDRILA